MSSTDLHQAFGSLVGADGIFQSYGFQYAIKVNWTSDREIFKIY